MDYRRTALQTWSKKRLGGLFLALTTRVQRRRFIAHCHPPPSRLNRSGVIALLSLLQQFPDLGLDRAGCVAQLNAAVAGTEASGERRDGLPVPHGDIICPE
jgi:hypothetical protein